MLANDKILQLMSAYDFKVQDAVFVSIGFKVESLKNQLYEDLFKDLKLLLDTAVTNISTAACF